MNNPYQASIELTIPQDQYTIAPGEKLEIPLVVKNQGSTPDQVRIGVDGIPLVWVSVDQHGVLLQPGQQARINLTIHPPEPPDVHIGRYNLILRVDSVLGSTVAAQEIVVLTVAGLEVKGRMGVLLQSGQYSVVPGKPLEVPVVLINQGLSVDTFRLSLDGLPENWVNISPLSLRLASSEVGHAAITLKPPREPNSSAGRYTFRIQVASQEAPNQSVSINCILTVAAFTEFESSLEAAQPDQNLPAHVLVHNLSNMPVSFTVAWSSPEDSLTFEPNEPQQVNVPGGELANLEYTVQPVRRPLFGGEKSYPYTVNVQAYDQQTQTLDSSLIVRSLLPAWVMIAGIAVLALLCLFAVWNIWLGGTSETLQGTATPTLTSTPVIPAPTATLSPIDQRPLLIERKWYLVAFNNTNSSLGAQEAYTLFNPNGTLIGYTGCKDLSANYQTNYNQISITKINLGPGVCPDATLQQQEEAMIAILRSARSYYVADTALQIAGDAGFLNYSLSPLNRPEGIAPPQAEIRMVPQSQVGQVVVFDGSASTGQVPLVSWRWDFGDRITASGVIVQHTYANAGTFTVRLTVTDQRGLTGSTTGQIHILPLPTPTAAPTLPPPTATPPKPTQPPQQPTYTPAPTPEPPTATPEPPPAPRPPQANIVAPSQGFIGEPVVFDASASQPGSSPITSYNWSLGNGESVPASPESRVSAIYNRAGNYEVTVFVSDANGLSSYATTRVNIDARLDTSVWTLSMINTSPLLPGTAITMQFKQGKLTGFAGCNTYHGNYTATANGDGTYTITIGQLQTSKLICPQDIMQQEQRYLEILQQASQARIQENQINLESPTGNLTFYLIKEN